MAGFLFVTFYVAMAGAALIVEAIFAILGLIPTERRALVVEASITWNYTTWLNIAFLLAYDPNHMADRHSVICKRVNLGEST
jgi:uncharacterized protein